MGWKTNEIGGDHMIAVVTENVGDDYLQYLQNMQISYIFAGKCEVDLKLAMEQLAEIRRYPENVNHVESINLYPTDYSDY